MTCKFDYDESVTVIEQGEYHGMVGVIIDRRAGGMLGMPGFGGSTQCFYTVKLSNGRKHTFPEASIQRSE